MKKLFQEDDLVLLKEYAKKEHYTFGEVLLYLINIILGMVISIFNLFLGIAYLLFLILLIFNEDISSSKLHKILIKELKRRGLI